MNSGTEVPEGASISVSAPPVATPPAVRAVAIIGAGNAGRDFALLCLRAGFDVVLEDVMPAKLRNAERAFAELASIRGTLRLALTVEDAVREADLAIDFVPDELESKLEIFCMIDRMAPPKTALLTPSDTLSITDLASCTYRGDRCFALRGMLETGSSVRLISPATAEPSAASAVQAFLVALGLHVTPEPDADAPMLVKNYL